MAMKTYKNKKLQVIRDKMLLDFKNDSKKAKAYVEAVIKMSRKATQNRLPVGINSR